MNAEDFQDYAPLDGWRWRLGAAYSDLATDMESMVSPGEELTVALQLLMDSRNCILGVRVD